MSLNPPPSVVPEELAVHGRIVCEPNRDMSRNPEIMESVSRIEAARAEWLVTHTLRLTSSSCGLNVSLFLLVFTCGERKKKKAGVGRGG